jgi:DNA mismatch endonuclease (patch repair protein)
MRKQYKNYLGRNFNKTRSRDVISKRQRSSLMSRIRSKNTGFEFNFVKTLKHHVKSRFLNHVISIKGNPDIVFMNQRICVFLDSDFWHGWQYPRWRHLLKNNFWRNKIIANRKRDKRTTEYLKKHGWTVLRLWEHKIKDDPIHQINRIKYFLMK